MSYIRQVNITNSMLNSHFNTSFFIQKKYVQRSPILKSAKMDILEATEGAKFNDYSDYSYVAEANNRIYHPRTEFTFALKMLAARFSNY